MQRPVLNSALVSKSKSGVGPPKIIGIDEKLAFKSGRPTLKSIAEICGLAVPTVSRALSGASDIGQSTRDRVRQVADEIGYVPNRAGVRLRTGKTIVISLVLINQIQPEDPRVKYLLERNFPFATHGRTMWSEQHPYFDFDNFEFARHATDLLAKRGRKSLLLISPPLSQNYSQNMITGMQSAAKKTDLFSDYFEEPTQNGTSKRLNNQLIEYLKRNPGTDGIITSTTVSAVGAINAISALGRQLGKDIDLCTKEVAPFFRQIRPEILTITEDVTKAGSFLARAALRAIDHPEEPPLQMLVTPEDTTEINTAIT